MRPKVSVVIPTYNRSSALIRAVKSVLIQTCQDFEVIIVDDCSSDDTPEAVKIIQDPRVRFVRHERNKGGNAARNTGINLAMGEFVAFLDSDDEWLPSKLAKQMVIFNKPEIGLVYCGLYFVDPYTGIFANWFVNCGPKFREDLLVSNFIGTTSGVVVRTELLKRINGLDESLRSCQDWDLYLRLSRICHFGAVEEALVRYQISRKGKGQISTNPDAVVSGQLAINSKYANEIAALSLDKKLLRMDHLLRVFVGVAHLEGVFIARDAFFISGHIKYPFIAGKIVIKRLLRNLGLV